MSNTLSITTYGNYLAFITEVSEFLVDTMGFTLDTDLAAEYQRAVSQDDYITALWTIDNNTKLKIVSNSLASGSSSHGVLFYYVIGGRSILINNVDATSSEYGTPQTPCTRTMNVVYHKSENSYAMQFVAYNVTAPDRNFNNYVIANLSGVYCCAKGATNTDLEIYDENGSVQSLATLFNYSAQNNADYAQIGVILNPDKVGTIDNIYSTSNVNPLTDYIINDIPMFSINSYVAIP